MPRRKNRRIIVIGKVREFDEEAWKRLLMAYVYFLHEQRMQRAKAELDSAEENNAAPEDPA